MKYRIKWSRRYEKDLKRVEKRGYDLRKLAVVVNKLANDEALEPKYENHSLKGEYFGLMECHIQPDWLLIYRYHEDELILFLSRTGTHSDLFP